ncbi:MAG: hypothetical protein ACYC1K_03230 [Minisyncoccota bacterium]
MEMTGLTKTMREAMDYLNDMLDRGVDPNEALRAAASKASQKGEGYADAKQMLAFLRFGVI